MGCWRGTGTERTCHGQKRTLGAELGRLVSGSALKGTPCGDAQKARHQ